MPDTHAATDQRVLDIVEEVTGTRPTAETPLADLSVDSLTLIEIFAVLDEHEIVLHAPEDLAAQDRRRHARADRSMKEEATMTSTYPFLSVDWQRAANLVLAAVPRPVTPPVTNPRLTVHTDTNKRFELVIAEDRPQFDLDSGQPTAEVTVPEGMLRRGLLWGEMQKVFGTAHSATGSRETLLYFAYHLFPEGPAGAAEMASRVRSLTADA